ncbi:flagellin 2 [Clostridium puniceum]|uniref:Flagellin 2 n=1 Tax=Clostridium puniceum TaxID=29367 RepID=A0A1S8TJH1_9CLOT|nr:flagellar hook-associated protein FlgL [Clostridium puniceum]OOM77918.1 flagellin 2 [Clostridium puniceum]
MPRITSSILVANYMNNMKRNLGKMSTLQNQLSSGNVIKRASENPYTATRIMQLNSEISANKQYNSNIKDTSNWLDTTDTALSQAGNVLSRIRELMVKAGNGAYGKDEISTIKDEVVEKVKQLGTILNSSFDGDYIFGGTKSNSKPIIVSDDGTISYADKNGNALPCKSDGTKITSTTKTATKIEQVGTDIKISYTNTVAPATGTDTVSTIKSAGPPVVLFTNSELETELNTAWPGAGSDLFSSLTDMKQIDTSLKAEISQGVEVEYNKTATDILEFTDPNTGASINVSDVLNDIIDNLTTASSTSLSTLTGSNLTQMDAITKNLLMCRASVGAMQNRMDSAADNNEEQNYNMTSILSEVGDVDFTEKTMEYSVAQTVYTATLQTSAKVLTKTLLDYL